MRGSRFGKGIALVLVGALGVFSAGCFGKFQLTRKVYDINQSIDEKYVRSAATWIFVIVPVYGVAALLDLIVFNVIEFWTGENPVASAPVTKVFAQGDGRTVLTLSRDGSATVALIERYEGERLFSTLRVRDDGAGKVTAVETVAGKEVREVAAATADTSRTFSPAADSTAAIPPRPSSRIRRVDTSVSPAYRSITATVAEPSRERVRTAFPSPGAYTFVTFASATGFSPDQNSITLKTMKSSNAATVYT